MRSYRLVALGCKVNRADAADIERALLSAGIVRARDGRAADLCVVCGCAVTAVAEGKSRRAVRRLARENGGATVVAAGCIALRRESSRAAGADVFLPPAETGNIVALLRELGRWRDLGAGESDGAAPSGFPGRTRAFVKIQDGCDGGCAYCIVPELRGPPRSRPAGEVMDEARRMIDSGHAEIVLAGIRLGAYADGRTDLVAIIERLLGLERHGLKRLRLSSIEPVDLAGGLDRLADLVASEPVLCPHFHLPLQSGDDEVLERMNRPYRTAAFRSLVERLRSRLEGPAVTTDVIAGFPGETERAHANSLSFLREIGFARVHVFPFSPRPGTAAAAMPREPGAGVARRRAAELVEEGRRAARAFGGRFVGRTLDVLAEPSRSEGRLRGYTERYVRVSFEGPRELAGRMVRVRAEAEGDDGALVGELVP